MPIDDVTDLLERWRTSGGVWSRSRVLRDGAALLRQLPAEERQQLARALSRQGAPALAERLGAEVGIPLDADQLDVAADELLSLDDARLDGLVASLRDPAERARLATGSAPLPPPPAPPWGAPDPPPVLAEPAASARAAPEPVVEVLPEPTAPRPDHAETPPGARPDPAEILGDEHADTASDLPADDDLIVHERIGGRDVRLDDPLTSTLEHLRRAPSATARMRIVAAGDRPLSAADSARLLEAVPDGWQRRRIALRLLAAGRLAEVPAATVLSRLTRPGDRRAVAWAMLDAGTARPSQLRDHLPAPTLDRLTARLDR